jgi:hypothetical protein
LAVGLALFSLSPGLALAEEPGSVKAQVPRSEARRAVTQAVEQIAMSAERQLGTKFTAEEKLEMVDSILSRMEGEDIYAFVE